MDSDDSRDDSGDANSSSSSSSSSPTRRSTSSDRSESSKKMPSKSKILSKPTGRRSPSSDSQSQPLSSQPAQYKSHLTVSSPAHLSGAHSDINSPENSMSDIPFRSKQTGDPKSPSDGDSNYDSPKHRKMPLGRRSSIEGPKTPQSPSSSPRSGPTSPDIPSRPASLETRSQPASPESRPPSSKSRPQPTSPDSRFPPASPPESPDKSQGSSQSSPANRNDWSPKPWQKKLKSHEESKMGKSHINRKSHDRSHSESSHSSRSSPYNKRVIKDPATEEISEGEMESDNEELKPQTKTIASDNVDGKEGHLNISHEDLSDVSDLDYVGQDDDKDLKIKSPPASPELVDTKVNGIAQYSPKTDNTKFNETSKLEKVPQEKTSNTEDGEEQLDFEAEEGECIEPKPREYSNGLSKHNNVEKVEEDVKAGQRSRGSSLEEGEVSDEGERRPEESEPRPVCRFYSRGACTWGVSCRFLHPGVTDKGNYNMFEVVRGVPSHAPPPNFIPRDPPPPESAWERGLRTAKEMLRIANKRKEQDMDFEEKKLHLSVGGVVHDPDAELAYAAAAVGASPPPPTLHHEVAPPHHREPPEFRPYGPMYRPPRYGHGRPVLDERGDHFYERERGYDRERGYERPHYEERTLGSEEASYHKRRVRSSREVIVQRAEVSRREGREGREREGREGREGREREGREGREGRDREGREGREGRDRESRDIKLGEEWADPWMRASPATKRRHRLSSDESYSSTSSHSSKSPGALRKRRTSSSARQRLSPSVIVRERRLATARATAMNPPAPRRRAPSPAATRQHAANPPPPASLRHKDELDAYGRSKHLSRGRDRDRKRYSRSSSSGSESSTSSSESESESRSSSSSGSSSETAKRGRQARLLNATARPNRVNVKSSSGLPLPIVTAASKKEPQNDHREIAGKKRPATSPVNSSAPKKSVSRREELLKQLKAVEDAIARKRSKI